MTVPMAENPETVAIAIRNAWIAWAKRQPNPKPHWLVPWAELDEPSREADRAIAKVFFKLLEDSKVRITALEAELDKFRSFAENVEHAAHKFAMPGVDEYQAGFAQKVLWARGRAALELLPATKAFRKKESRP